MPRKKIMHLVEAFGGGVYTYLVGLANKLCQEYDVVIAYAKRGQTPDNFKDEFNKNIKFIEVKSFSRNIGKKDLKAIKEVRQIVQKEKPDIVHMHSSKAGIIGRLAIDDKNIKLFYTPHGYAFLKQDDSKFRRSIYKLVEKTAAMYKKECTTIACSEGEYLQGLRIYNNCNYVNNGIDMHEIDTLNLDGKREKGEKLKICVSGRIDVQKNPKMFNEIAKKFPNIDFLWIGDGWKKGLLTSNNIKITGWESREDVLKDVADCDVFLLPSIWEGLPMSLLEAMYLGKPCIVSDISGNNNVIKNEVNGFVCKDLNNYLDVITGIVEGKYDINKISQNAKKTVVEELNLDNMAKKYVNIYKKYNI